MTTQTDEMDMSSIMSQPETDMPPEGMEITTDVSTDGSVVLGDPVSQDAERSQDVVYVYANGISSGSEVPDTNIVTFDVTFSVSCTCPDTGKGSTYQVIKRIGIDKMKMAQDAKMTVPVSIVEAKQEPVVESFSYSANDFKRLAGLK